MLRHCFLLLVATISLTAPAFGDPPPNHAVTSIRTGPDFLAAVEKKSFELINQYRQEQHLPAFVWSDGIAKLAREHSKDMASGETNFGHGGFRDRVGKLKDLMPGFDGAGENVFMSSQLDDVAKQAVTTWLHSPHHLANIRGDFNYSGLGVWQNKDGVIYFTQLFLKTVPQHEEAAAKSAPDNSITALLASPYTR